MRISAPLAYLRRWTLLFSVFTLLLFLSVAGQAQTYDDRNFARGFDPEQIFDEFGNDDINILNGNLTLSIPIGRKMKNNGQLSLQLGLFYNSKIWSNETKEYCETSTRIEYLEGRSPVGLGFTLHLGRVYDRVFDNTDDGYARTDEVYFESPDGNRHRLFHMETVGSEEYWETKDCSYIRGVRVMDGSEPDHWIIYLPSGTWYVLDQEVKWHGDWHYTNGDGSCSCHSDEEYKLHDCFRGYYTKSIHDRFGNEISVEYWGDDGGPDEEPNSHPGRKPCIHFITFTDITGATRQIKFNASANFSGPDYTGLIYGGYITSIEIPADDGTNAVYTFTYDTMNVVAPNANPYGTFMYYCGIASQYDDILVLKTLEFPQNEEGDREEFQFGYNAHGELNSVLYPNNKKATYLYDDLLFSSRFNQPKYQDPITDLHYAVTRQVTRRSVSEGSGSVYAYWTYTRPDQPDPFANEWTTHPPYVEVKGPLPSRSGRFLTRYDYYYSEVHTNYWEQNAEDGLVKTIIVYDDENGSHELKRIDKLYDYHGTEQAGGNTVYIDTQEIENKTTWPTTGANTVVIERKMENSYQGFGHYATTKVLQGTESNTEVIKAESNEWFISPGNVYNDNWLVNTPKTNKVYGKEHGGPDLELCSFVEYVYNSSDGRLEQVTIHREENPGRQPNVVSYSYDNDGNLVHETSTVAGVLGSPASYYTNYTYSGCVGGYTVTKGFTNSQWQSIGWYSENNTIDSDTGLITLSKDPSNMELHFTYDDLGRMTKIEPYDTEHNLWTFYTHFEYDDEIDTVYQHRRQHSGYLQRTSSEFEYVGYEPSPGASNLVRYEKHCLPNTSTSRSFVKREYGPEGALVKEYVPGEDAFSNVCTEWEYDSLGRIDYMKTPDTKRIPGDEKIEYSYDGLTTTVTTPTDNNNAHDVIVKMTKDGLGRVVEVQEKLDSTHWITTTYHYDGMGRLLRVAQGTQVRWFVYDLQGNLIDVTEPEKWINYLPQGSGSNSHDAMGNVLVKQDGKGIISYTYDAAGRVLTEKFYPGSTGTGRVVTTYEYDSGSGPCKGKLTRVKENEYTSSYTGNYYEENYTYGGAGMQMGLNGAIGMVEMTVHMANLNQTDTWTTLYKWNQDGEVMNLNYPRIVGDPRYVFVANIDNYRNHIRGLTATANNPIWPGGGTKAIVGGIKYHPNSSVKQWTYASNPGPGSQTIIIADDQLRPSNMRVTKGGTDFYNMSYDYDGIGRIETITGTDGVNDFVDEYSYDLLSRLVTADVYSADFSNQYSFEYEYDNFGNMKNRELTSGFLTTYPSLNYPNYNADNQLSDSARYDYDGAGNMTKCWDTGTSMYHFMSYDGKSRVSGYRYSVVDPPMLAGHISYLYDHRGRRVAKKDTNQQKYTIYLRDVLSGQVLSEFELDYSTATREAEWKRHNMFLGRKLMFSVNSQNFSPGGLAPGGRTIYTNAYRFYHHDHLDTTAVVFSDTGVLKNKNKYTPFGFKLPPLINDAGESSQKFTGHERDTESGMDYMFKRYYSQHLARFLSTDLVGGNVGSSQSWNKYTYCSNDPINMFDPDGRLERDTNGKLIFNRGQIGVTGHGGDRNRSYIVHRGTLTTDKGNPIEAFTVSRNKAGEGTGKILEAGTGTVLEDRPDSSNPMATDCHGTTFADGQFWINNNQVDTILADDGYSLVTDGAKVGDVGVYRNGDGDVVHSVTVTGVDEFGNVTSVEGLAGLGTEVKETAPDMAPGAGGAELEVYRQEE